MESIINLHPGPASALVIPVLPQFNLTRPGGRIRLSQRVAEASNNEATSPKLPDYRRLRREPPLLFDEREATPANPTRCPSRRSSEGEISSEEEVESPIQPPAKIQPLDFEQDPEIMLRFPTPCDEYSPAPSPPPAAAPTAFDRSSVGSAIPTKSKMQFAYPPVPRTPPPGHAEDGAERSFSPGDCWLRKMLSDLERNRKELCDDLEEAKKEAGDALVEVTKADLASKKEVAETQDFIKRLQAVVGTDFIKDLIEGTDHDEKKGDPGDAEDPVDTDGEDQLEGEMRSQGNGQDHPEDAGQDQSEGDDDSEDQPEGDLEGQLDGDSESLSSEDSTHHEANEEGDREGGDHENEPISPRVLAQAPFGEHGQNTT